MGLLKCGNVVIPFDNQIRKDTSLYKLYNTNLHEKISEMKEEEKQKIHSIIVTLMVKSYQMSKDV